MPDYYSEKLNANKLEACYNAAPPRVKQYLEAEISFVLDKIGKNDLVMELGCGYGRVTERLTQRAKRAVGIDISFDNLALAREKYGSDRSLGFYRMDAVQLAFPDDLFDVVACVQNGISAFKIEPRKLLEEALRVTKKGGKLLFSSYSANFWEHRLEWFEIQAKEGLIGDIDHSLTKNGEIVCTDGFRAVTFSGDEFRNLADEFGLKAEIYVVDESSVFSLMTKN